MRIETYLGLPREKFQSENLCEKLSQMREKKLCRGCTGRVQSKGLRQVLHVVKYSLSLASLVCKNKFIANTDTEWYLT